MTQDIEYQMTSPREIAHLLQSIRDNQSLILVQPPNQSFNAVTTILQADADMLVFDVLQDDNTNRQLAAAGKMLCETSVDQIRVSFEAPNLRLIPFEGRFALQARMPKQLAYVQRRDIFRAEVPDGWNITCTVNAADAMRKPARLKVRDISSTGMGLADDDRILDVTSVQTFTGLLDLGRVGTHDVEFRIVHHYDEPMIRGRRDHTRRVGCAFADMHESLSIRIQSFVNLVQREQIARERGLA
jgi:c-di-GMP-binding flagellar brake protein YcgR